MLKTNRNVGLRANRGQGIIEYVIISSLVGIFCLVAMKQLGGVLEKRTRELKKQIVSNMKLTYDE